MNMVEKVARALCRADGKDPDAFQKMDLCEGGLTMPNWQIHYQFAARQAIEAMEEPTPFMEDAGAYAFECGVYEYPVMIRAALEEK